MNEIIKPNHLSLDEHIEEIQRCLKNTRDSILETVSVIQRSKDELGDEVFDNELSERIGMSKSTLSRWLSIGNSKLILENPNNVPSSFSGLYELTLLEKNYVEHYDDGYSKLTKLVEKGEISSTTPQSKIIQLLKVLKDRINRKNKKVREDKINDLNKRVYDSKSEVTTLSKLIEKKKIFRTFYINLTPSVVSRWGDDGFFDYNIHEDFPLHELRSISTVHTVLCLMKVPMNKIDVGIKVLNSFGFNYRDTFVPHHPSEGMFKQYTSEHIIIRGERGIPSGSKNGIITGTNTSDILEYCEKVSSSPFISVFEDVDRKNWTCIEEDFDEL